MRTLEKACTISTWCSIRRVWDGICIDYSRRTARGRNMLLHLNEKIIHTFIGRDYYYIFVIF
jgi:hypothetical protein